MLMINLFVFIINNNIFGISASKPCLSHQNNCSHLCLKVSEHKHVCDCPTGMSLSASNNMCHFANRSYEIYFADSFAESVNHLVKYVGQDGFTIKPLIIPSNEKLDYPVALDYDPYERYIYWTDGGNKKVGMVSHNIF